MFKSFVPELFLSLKDYSRAKFVKDILAGIIVGIIALPLSIALSIASGAGPEAGLITAVVAGFVAAAFGGSKTQVTGPTGAFVVIVYGIIQGYSYSGLLLATLLAGIIIVIMGLLKFGRFLKFIPLSVIVGFTAGIAATIFISQLNDFLGAGLTGLPSESFHKLIAVITNLGNTDLMTLLLGLIAVALLIVIPKISSKLPAALIAILICTVLNLFMGCTTLGDLYGSVTINVIPSVTFIDFSVVPQLIVPALKIAFLATIESLLSAVVADGMQSTKHNPNAEIIGQGLANIVSPLFGGLPATGAIARTSANIKNGGKTPVSAIVHSVTVLLLALVFMPLAVYIPMTVFAAILIVVCKNMINIKEIKEIYHSTISDFILMTATFALTVIFDLVVAISVCTAVSLIIEAVKHYRFNKSGEATLTGDTLKLAGVLNYINSEKLFGQKSIKEPVVFDMADVISIDSNVVNHLSQFARNNEISSIKSNDRIKFILKKHEDLNRLIEA